MANRSKKHLILQASLPLFLAKGYKGTSVDSVVKASNVSKPTVYNHFPDKSDLFLEVIHQFVAAHKPCIENHMDDSEVDEQIQQYCLNDLSVRILGIVLAEGFRCNKARQYFMEHYVEAWYQAIKDWSDIQSMPNVDKVSQLKVSWFDALSGSSIEQKESVKQTENFATEVE
jgi:TetR/AcrR family transcriptional regulator of autoinduction and epiphytic fitness